MMADLETNSSRVFIAKEVFALNTDDCTAGWLRWN